MQDLWNKTKKYGLKRGLFEEDAEDFASFVIEQKLKSPNRRIYMKIAFTDYLRYRYARAGQKNFKDKKAITRPLLLPEPPGKSIDIKNPATNVFALIRPEIRPYFICRYYFNLSVHDIGLIFNKQYSCISSSINIELKRIYDVIRKEGP